MCNRTPESSELEVVREAPPAVDLDHRQPRAVCLLEGGIARNVDLPQLEVELVAQPAQLFERTLAQVATRRMEDGDVRLTGRCHA